MRIFDQIEKYITQAELARECGVGSAQVINAWKVKNSVPHTYVHRVIEVLNSKDKLDGKKGKFSLTPLQLCPGLDGPFKWEEKK